MRIRQLQASKQDRMFRKQDHSYQINHFKNAAVRGPGKLV